MSTISEDETSFAMHTDWLISEARKSSPDEGQIDEKMALTWHLRLSYVASASVREAKIKHPYMMVFERVSRFICYEWNTAC